ncbi:MAG: RdgB/HAM1 family non-canonical purine NTP pyrophosphatase [Spirochaetota bacterium]
MELLLSTNNDHKRREFASIFPDFTIRTPRDLGITLEVDETGTTFYENALLKATSLQALVGAEHAESVIIADDSGLCVEALGGGPGIYSARYGSPDGGMTELDAPTRNELLLRSLEGAEDRSAHFVCCMVALLSNDRIIIAQESWMGTIAAEPSRATGGFGYDPVFLVPELGVTAADLDPAEKNRRSHRGRASRVLAAALDQAGRLD